jgi:hypothetical protein
MKKVYGILLLTLFAAAAAHAQQDEIPIFDLDDYLLEPKMKISVGFRALTGQKTSFSGTAGVTGLIRSTQAFGDTESIDVRRNYHDGYVTINTRVDEEGNPIVDGRTNNWLFLNESQYNADLDAVAFSSYSAEVMDNQTRNRKGGNSFGTELIVARDMGRIGSRVEWNLFAGLSVNDINDSARDTLLASVTTVTDLYSLNGQTLPNVPYSAPSTGLDADGNVINTTVLLGQKPDSRTTTVTTDVPVSAYWKVKGAYLTARAGPSLTYQIAGNFRLTVSAGVAVAYVGTNYTVEQAFQPATSDIITAQVTELDDDILPGYYVDASMEYLLGDRASLYFGAFYQSHGEYNQQISDPAALYSTRIDLSRLQGFRGGLNYRF